jgi:ActR/RegA family two-component response regulator
MPSSQPAPQKGRLKIQAEEVLVVDDTQVIGEHIAHLIGRAGHLAHYAGSTEEALQILQSNKITHVIVDFNLRQGSSVSFIECILKPRDIPFSIITAAAPWITTGYTPWAMTQYKGRVFDVRTGIEALVSQFTKSG